MELFKRYDLWSFFSIILTYLLKDFQKRISDFYGQKLKITIQRDKESRLSLLKKGNWILIKNNIKNTTAAKIRFLIPENEYNYITDLLGEKEVMSCFKTIIYRLKKMTGIDEIEKISSSKLIDPNVLGNSKKYFAINLSININKKTINLLFVIRDEMLLFPIGKVSTDFISKINDKLFKKAFIELDKRIVWDGMKNWGSELTKRMHCHVKDYPIHKFRLYPSNNTYAYKLFLQYLHILKLIFKT